MPRHFEMGKQDKHEGEQPSMSRMGAFSTAAMLVSGTAAAVLTKTAYELESVGLDGMVHHFEKPWALTTTMFLGMALCLPVAYYQKYQQRSKELQQQAQQHASGSGAALRGRSPLELVFDAEEASDAAALAVPALLDLIATALTYYGLLSVTASVYQMLRGAMLVFAALFGTVFLKRQLNSSHYGGIAATLVGVVVVGAASLLSADGSATHDVAQADMLTGLVACLAGQAMQAAQVTVEEYVMGDRSVSPTKVVGYEGVVGAAATLLVLLPLLGALPDGSGGVVGALHGLYEDPADTLAMLHNSPALATVLAADLAAFCCLNLSGMVVISELGAVYKSLMEATRTLTVWLVGLGLYYGGVGSGLGERWGDHSWIQLAGFAGLVWGTQMYGKGSQKQMEEQAAMAAAQAEEEEKERLLLAAASVKSEPGGELLRELLLLETTAAAAAAVAAGTSAAPSCAWPRPPQQQQQRQQPQQPAGVTALASSSMGVGGRYLSLDPRAASLPKIPTRGTSASSSVSGQRRREKATVARAPRHDAAALRLETAPRRRPVAMASAVAARARACSLQGVQRVAAAGLR